ncbi:hypothetical protein, variant [Aphanomyces astaci]|uniref:Tyr recombinase domain-containing protein n=1 Tax=Aphanomyces astaci TaxID=112090 RepID=W4GRB0_APHAT|nr:hypothetical protein H257_04934 [Aphanomyces astaci]XP_009827901.1 hypothetical protein, variant [Aphanomyces astaci]ETV82231.1 hypothetical protein H257_04934 [Aphanomyces astaci]ETV82232.1 hypothetical protein, variant [Aphanomyces astaci]|eukprot:XP_009827900.1 hypothetical protein H257_04934 [Aphanomyces astaci]
MHDELEARLKDFANGYKRHIAQLREDGEMPIGEGKLPMTVDGYAYLAKAALSARRDHFLAVNAHTFLLFCWNLMARSVSTASIRFDNVTWQGDALLVKFGRTKSNQEGAALFPKHVYANPLCLWICPILSLAVIVFTRSLPVGQRTTLIFGVNAQIRFSKWLLKTCAVNEADILAMGMAISEIGTHSFRKGVATALSNTPGWTPGGIRVAACRLDPGQCTRTVHF